MVGAFGLTTNLLLMRLTKSRELWLKNETRRIFLLKRRFFVRFLLNKVLILSLLENGLDTFKNSFCFVLRFFRKKYLLIVFFSEKCLNL
jgi:hypothetical protein